MGKSDVQTVLFDKKKWTGTRAAQETWVQDFFQRGEAATLAVSAGRTGYRKEERQNTLSHN
jgi:hypothetical protein